MAWLRGEDQRYIPPRMTNKQMLALEQFIILSPDASEFAKRVIIWVLRQTQNLTRQVALSIWNEQYGSDRAAEVQDSVHAMNSMNSKTRMDLFFDGMGTEMMLEHHCGCFEASDGHPFNTKASGRTIWFSFVFYDDKANVLEAPSLDELEAMSLPES